ncbi:hypothetical protein BY458DRAFT_486940 [Sporodiniella umbellata]|nr:hypothetical protein BY458DRAFT_486940 [Sporodiniella umbellata]
MIGPEIPKSLLKKKNNSDEIVMSDEENDIGPKIPKELLNKKSNSDEIVMSDEENDIGPKIPQNILEKRKGYKEAVLSDEEDDIGPQIPQTVGPKIPADILRKRHEEIVMSNDEDIEPVRNSEERKTRVSGSQMFLEEEANPSDYTPELPPDLIQQRRTVQPQPGRRRAPIGPSMPSEFLAQEEDDEDDVIGPSLPQNYDTEEASKYSTLHDIEERARQSRENLENKKENAGKVERPEWMLAPPDVDYLKNGTKQKEPDISTSSKSRQFSNKPVGAVDSSSWTDTPEEKERKRRQGGGEKRKAEEPRAYSASEIERKRAIENYNKQERPLSLLELHQKKKKKSKEPVEDVTKRAFDREKDLMAPRMMNSKQKKEMLRQSTQFSDRFGHGRGSFL